MTPAANASVVVIAIMFVVWTVVAVFVALKMWKVLEKMNAKLDDIARDLRQLSEKGGQLLDELHKISATTRGQIETVGTIVQDVRNWVNKVEHTADFVQATFRNGVTSSFANARAFFQGMMGFLQFFARRSNDGDGVGKVSTGKENDNV